MKTLLIWLALASGAMPLCAQTDSVGETERARIAAERKQVDSRFALEEAACYRKFAVNDCLNAARADRRARLSDLRRQELSLNDAERKRRAADRLRTIEEDKAQKEEGRAADRAASVARQQDKQEELARRAAERARPRAPAREPRVKGEPREPKPSSRQAREEQVQDTAEALRQHEQRQKEAQERRERVAKRLAQPPKPEVKPLPVPP